MQKAIETCLQNLNNDYTFFPGFSQDGLRMIVSRDLDCSNTLYIQFSFKFITKGARLLAVATVTRYRLLLLTDFAVTVLPLGLCRSPGALPLGAVAVLCKWRNQLAPAG